VYHNVQILVRLYAIRGSIWIENSGNGKPDMDFEHPAFPRCYAVYSNLLYKARDAQNCQTVDKRNPAKGPIDIGQMGPSGL
jgi:hypothetical protein